MLKKVWIKNKNTILVLFIFTTIFCMFLFFPNFNIGYDDGIQHVYRLIGTLDSIKDSQTIPMIMPNLCNGFGYSWSLFYSPFTAFIPLIFKIFPISYSACLKIFLFLGVFLSGLFMKIFVEEVLPSSKSIKDEKKIEWIAIFSGVIYIFSAYRLTDIYIRIAVSEATSFMFIPLIFLGLYRILNEGRKSYILAISSSLLIITHSMIAVYIAVFSFIYLLLNIKKLKDKKTFSCLAINIVLILLFTAFYYIPLLESKISADYEVFNKSHMLREDALIELKVKPYELIYTKEGRMSYQIGWISIIGIILTPFAIKKIDKSYIKMYLMFLILGTVLVIMTLDVFPFEKLPSFFTMLQFSFRLLEFSSFFFTFVACINLGVLIVNFGKKDCLVLGIITYLLLIPIFLVNVPYGIFNEENIKNAVPVTAKTGRVHAGCASFEYLPSKAFNNLNYLINREDIPVVLENNANISEFKKNKTNASFKIETLEKNVQIELPYIFYIGYKVDFVSENGKCSLDISESENGFLKIEVPKNSSGIIYINYSGSALMKIGYVVSIFSFTIFVIIYTIRKSRSKIPCYFT